MEFLLNEQLSETNNEDLEQRIQQELDQFVVNEDINSTSKSFLMEKPLIEDEKLEEDKAWLEFMKGNQARNLMLEEFEKNIKQLNEITKTFKKTDEGWRRDEEEGGRRKEEEDRTMEEEGKMEVVGNRMVEQEMRKGLENKKDEGRGSTQKEGQTREKERGRSKEGEEVMSEKKETRKGKEETEKKKSKREEGKREKEEDIRRKTEREWKDIEEQEWKRVQEQEVKVQTKTNFFKKNAKPQKISEPNLLEEERIFEEAERYKMQREDVFSRKLELFLQQQRFQGRFRKLPSPLLPPSLLLTSQSSSFPLLEDLFVMLEKEQKEAVFKLPVFLENNERNRLPPNSKENCIQNLRKLVNPKRLSVELVSKQQSGLFALKVITKPKVLEISIIQKKLLTHQTTSFEHLYIEKINKISSSFPPSQYIPSPSPLLPPSPSLLPPFSSPSSSSLLPPFRYSYPELLDLSSLSPSLLSSLISLPPPLLLSKRSFELRLENLSDPAPIANFKNLRYLSLSSNRLSSCSSLSSLLLLEDLNLSMNLLTSYSSLSLLPTLKVLNLEVNFLQIMDLPPTSLEVLNLNNNQIQHIQPFSLYKEKGNNQMNGWGDNKGHNIKEMHNKTQLKGSCLRKLLLFGNRIENMKGLESYLELEEIDLGRNRIRKLISLKELRKLRRLVVYSNLVEEVESPWDHESLVELWMNRNFLGGWEGWRYLPVVRVMNLEENLIASFQEGGIFCAPCLKKLMLGGNKVRPLSFLEFFRKNLGSGRGLKELDLRGEVWEEVGEEVKELMKEAMRGVFETLESFNGEEFVKREERRAVPLKVPLNDPLKREFAFKCTKFRLLSQEYQTCSSIESRKLVFSPFSSSSLFHLIKSFLTQLHLTIISSHPSSSIHFHFIPTSLLLKTNNVFDKIYKCLTRKISLFFKAKIKRKKYYLSNLSKIVLIQAWIRGWLVRRKRVDLKKLVFIQKVVRGWLLRRRKKRLFAGIKYEDGDLDEMLEEEVSFFQPDLPSFDLKIPENLVSIKREEEPLFLNKIESSIERSKELLIERSTEHSNKKELIKINEESDNISEISIKSTKAPKFKRNEHDEKIVEEWGFQKTGLKEIFKMRLEKDRRRKEAKEKKGLTAEERFAKFTKLSKK